MSSTETNKATYGRMIAAMDRQDFAAVRETFAADFVAHPSGQSMPAEGFEQMGRMFYAAFPDGRHEVHGMVADGDQVVARVTFSGTHTADFMGIPPSGKRQSCTGVQWARVRDGKISELWGEFDQLGLLQRMGAIPGGAP